MRISTLLLKRNRDGGKNERKRQRIAGRDLLAEPKPREEHKDHQRDALLHDFELVRAHYAGAPSGLLALEDGTQKTQCPNFRKSRRRAEGTSAVGDHTRPQS